MFYEPTTAREFASLPAFRAAYPNTSFGDLADEDQRNAAGLFSLGDDRPAFNHLTHTLEPGAIEQQGGAWVRSWVLVPMPLADLRASLTSAVTTLRWERETGGIALAGGMSVGTAIDDQNRITSVVANAQAAGVATVDFKAASGWVTLTLQEVQAIAAAIALHVQACFTAERAHHAAIAAGDTQALLAYDIEAGWPVGAG
jgi:hypothetical protein